MLRRVRTRVRSLLRPTETEADLDKELSFHVDMLTEHHLRAGMAPGEARRAALSEFGSIAQVKDNVRDTWLSRVVEALVHDVRYGARNLRRNPGYGAMVIITMALGIGANTAIFSLLDSVMLRSLPVHEPHRLVMLGGSWTNPVWEQIRGRQDRFSDGAFAWSTSRFDLAAGGESDYVNGIWETPVGH